MHGILQAPSSAYSGGEESPARQYSSQDTTVAAANNIFGIQETSADRAEQLKLLTSARKDSSASEHASEEGEDAQGDKGNFLAMMLQKNNHGSRH